MYEKYEKYEEIVRKKLIPLILQETEETYEYEGTNKPHDKLIKDVLNTSKEFSEFINYFIAENESQKIEENNVEQIKNSFITKNYYSKKIDILYKQKNKEIYYLVEHQSKIDYSMIYRILNYYTTILNDIVDKEKIKTKEYKIPKIIPIVIYTGEGKWTAETKLKEKEIKYKEQKNYINIEYKIININNYTNEELLKLNSKVSYAFLIEKSKTKEKLIEVLEQIAKECNTEEKAKKMQDITRYILSARLEKEKIDKIIKKYDWKGGDSIMTARECWIKEIEEENRKEREAGIIEGKRVGIAEGKKEGIKEGIRYNLRETAKKMLNKKMQIEDISEVTGLSKSEIKRIKLSIGI